ncbi:hypothetical protein QBC34DRAFT_475113 [Podospora aff. communis PSN243]|uniref:Uncharacterized protein n=1 Tax=Podospora aff. communis PSN243 TaxID=3040156 RepID=A0AAV9G7P5_9PEZI|nr:hypothetical protein QBC34DRAFT_475113 [Podospora aff. communis PSN243]
MASDTHELVMAYADPAAPKALRDNVVYIQQTPSNNSDSTCVRLVPLSRRPGIRFVCRFDSVEDIAEFQIALLGESLNLAISHVSSICYTPSKPKATASLDRCGVQIWHEVSRAVALNSQLSRDAASRSSLTVNGTKLAERPTEEKRPQLTRIVIFPPRVEECLFLYATHDIELVKTGEEYGLSILLRPRKSSRLSALRAGNRSSPSFFKLWHVRHTRCSAAGFPLNGSAPDPDHDETNQRCSNLQIVFERIQEYRDYIDIWDQAMSLRHEEKKALQALEEEMSRKRYTAKDAVRLRF